MRLSFNLPYFECPANIRPYLKSVFEGEYDVPIFHSSPVILDLGANVGSFSLWAAHRWPGSVIHAYEPEKGNFKILQRNITNGSLSDSIKANNWAIGNPGPSGHRPLFLGKNNCGEGSLVASCGGTDGSTGYHVEVRDPLTLPEADIIKMDTEGCEVEILEPLLKDGREFAAVLFEFHSIEHRRHLDALLKDYVLMDAKFYAFDRGTVKYLHKDIIFGRTP